MLPLLENCRRISKIALADPRRAGQGLPLRADQCGRERFAVRGIQRRRVLGAGLDEIGERQPTVQLAELGMVVCLGRIELLRR